MNLLFYFENQINPMCGGTERVVDTIAHAMRNRGHSVYYMSRRRLMGNMIFLVTFYLMRREIRRKTLITLMS